MEYKKEREEIFSLVLCAACGLFLQTGFTFHTIYFSQIAQVLVELWCNKKGASKASKMYCKTGMDSDISK